MSSCAPPRRTIGPSAIAIHDNTNGVQTVQTARVIVWGLDPRLNVAVIGFWQPEGSNSVPTSVAGSNVWTAKSVVRDGKGSAEDLNTIFSGRSLPDGYEFITGAPGIAFDFSLVYRIGGGGDEGTFFVQIEAAPEAGLSHEDAEALLANLKVDLPKQLLLQTLS